jgi:hypothetical protein
MARSLNARIAALEALEGQRLRRMVAQTAAEFGIDPDELIEEARAFFRLSLDAQLAEVDRLAGHMPAIDIDAIKTTLAREYRP